MGYAEHRHSAQRQNVQSSTERPVRNDSTGDFPGFLSPLQGEKLIMIVHPSAMNYLWWIFIGIVLIPILLGVLPLLIVYINVKTTTYVVTDKRVVSKVGLLNVNQSEVRIDDIRGVNIKRGLWQRIIGTGVITIGTAATGGAEISLMGVGNPNGIVEYINSQRKA